MSYETKTKRAKAVLVSVILPKTTEEDNTASLAELGRLAHTLGYDVLTTLSQRRSALAGGTVVGAGKLKTLAKLTGGSGLVQKSVPSKKHKASEKFLTASIENEEPIEEDFNDEESQTDTDDLQKFAHIKEKASVVIFDGELTPSQCANLQSATGAEVLDRTGVIVEIFSRHAKTPESKLQVEIARLSYLAPRIREAGGTGGDRVEGKAGETKIELDRRKIRDRLSELRNELELIQNDQSKRRKSRSKQPCVALVGYTNAGKSSLMRALTGSQVLVEDKLFATLDTTVRPIFPETRPKILVSDTVGFIKKLPHDLVASFRSTLEEAKNASLLLFVVDSSDPNFRTQLQTTHQVLSEIGVEDIPQKLILNKIDNLKKDELEQLLQEFPDAIPISALNKSHVIELIKQLVEFFEKDMIECEIFIPYSENGTISEIKKNTKIISEDYNENGVQFKLRVEEKYFTKLKKIFHLKPIDKK